MTWSGNCLKILHDHQWLPTKQIHFDFDVPWGSPYSRYFLTGFFVGAASVGGYQLCSRYLHGKEETEIQSNAEDGNEAYKGSGELCLLRNGSVENISPLNNLQSGDFRRDSQILQILESDNCNAAELTFTDSNIQICRAREPICLIRVKVSDASTQCDFEPETSSGPELDVSPIPQPIGLPDCQNNVGASTEESCNMLPNHVRRLFGNNTRAQSLSYFDFNPSTTSSSLFETDSVRKLDGAITEVNTMLRKLGNMLEQTRIDFTSRRSSLVSNYEYNNHNQQRWSIDTSGSINERPEKDGIESVTQNEDNDK